MSENYELLQEGQLGLGSAPMFATDGDQSHAVGDSRATAKESNSLAAREESLKLVQRLFLNPQPSTPKAVLFCGVDVSAPCSALCAEIARLLAESVPSSVCVVEGNVRTPSLPQTFGVNNHHGLVDALRQQGAVKQFTTQLRPGNLWLLSSGALTPYSPLLLSGVRMKERIAELRREFEFLLIDAPPLNSFADGIALGQLVDGVVLILEANTTRREVALRVTESLKANKIPVLGAVLNNRTFPIPDAVYKRL